MRTLRTYDISRTHVSFIIRDIWRYEGLLLGGPTYDMGLFPPLQNPMSLLTEKRLANKKVGLLGIYGGSGGGVEKLEAFVEALKLQKIEPVIKAQFSPTNDHMEECRRLGRAMAHALMT